MLSYSKFNRLLMGYKRGRYTQKTFFNKLRVLNDADTRNLLFLCSLLVLDDNYGEDVKRPAAIIHSKVMEELQLEKAKEASQ